MTRFLRARRERSRFGDERKAWVREDRAVKVTYCTQIDGVPLTPTFKVIRLLPSGESLVSRHRVKRAALRAASRVR